MTATDEMSPEDDATEHLTFVSGDHRFAVRISDVTEIRAWGPITPVPGSPTEVLGITNLRGVLLPVVDFAQLMSLAPTDQDDRKVIIVTRKDDNLLGILVDTVSDIIYARGTETDLGFEGRQTGAAGRKEEFLQVDGKPVQVVSARTVFEAVAV
jgi:chemotaxis signal transduction protein